MNKNIINKVPDVVHEFLSLKKKELRCYTQWEVIAYYLINGDKLKTDFQDFMNYKRIDGDIISILRGEEKRSDTETNPEDKQLS